MKINIDGKTYCYEFCYDDMPIFWVEDDEMTEDITEAEYHVIEQKIIRELLVA
jgi:hypothetical protein